MPSFAVKLIHKLIAPALEHERRLRREDFKRDATNNLVSELWRDFEIRQGLREPDSFIVVHRSANGETVETVDLLRKEVH